MTTLEIVLHTVAIIFFVIGTLKLLPNRFSRIFRKSRRFQGDAFDLDYWMQRFDRLENDLETLVVQLKIQGITIKAPNYRDDFSSLDVEESFEETLKKELQEIKNGMQVQKSKGNQPNVSADTWSDPETWIKGSKHYLEISGSSGLGMKISDPDGIRKWAELVAFGRRTIS